jgi:hypothetical protein
MPLAAVHRSIGNPDSQHAELADQVAEDDRAVSQ